jgi:hypothetical protein
MKPLTPPQQKLLDDLRAGASCHFHPYAGRFNPREYFTCWPLTGRMYRCTAQLKALVARDLVEVYDSTWRGAKVRVKTQPAA